MQAITSSGREEVIVETRGLGGLAVGGAVSALQDGGYVYVWRIVDIGLRAQFFDANGEPKAEAFDVGANSGQTPDATTLADGSVVLTYHRSGQTISGQRFSEKGNPIGDEFTIYRTTDHISFVAGTTALPDGGFVVTYDGYPNPNVYARVFDADGTPRGNDFRVNQTTDSFRKSGDLVSLADGGFAVTWASRHVDGSASSVMLRLYDPDGAPRSGEIQINQYWQGYQDRSAITVLKNGNLLLTWVSDPILSIEPQDGSGSGVYARIIEPDGTPVGDEFQVHTQTQGDQYQSEVVALADGGFVIVWTTSSGFSSIMGQRFSAEGEPIGAETSLSQTMQEIDFAPEVIELSDGVISVSWREYLIEERLSQIETRLFLTPDLGSDGNDVLSGTHLRDRLEAMRGDDRLLGYAGNDRLIGGLGQDTIKGHSGSDRLFGGNQKDKIFGGNDADFLSGGKGRDILNGEAGDDVLKGGAGADVFVFGEGQDTILDFDNDFIRLDNALWQNEDLTSNEIMQFAEIENGSLIFDFGGGNTLTLTGYTDLNTLESALSVF